jgi:hypothetical protein
MKTRSWIAALAAMATVFAAPASFAGGDGPVPKLTPVKVVTPPLGCPDLVAKLTVGTTLVNGKGQVALHGKICNEGTHGFVVPPQPAMRGEFRVVTWHPPKTPAQEQNDAVIGAAVPIATQIPIGQCVAYEQQYTFDGIVRWLTPAIRPVLGAGERVAHKEFSFYTLYPVSGYTYKASDDCNTNNNSASVVVTYVDKN